MKRCTFFAVAILVLLNSSCAIRRSGAKRINSFKPHIGRQIDKVEVHAFLASRVALLLADDQLPAFPTNEFTLRPREGSKEEFHALGGSAVAIDRRGYFLTASHLTTKKVVYLLFRSEPAGCVGQTPIEQQTRSFQWAERARVVWQSKSPDLAILHVPRQLDHVFECKKDYHTRGPVMAAGVSHATTNFLGLDFMGGEVQYYVGPSKKHPFFAEVHHNVPLQNGDSGGPLVSEDGRLIGINNHGTLRIFLILPRWEIESSAVHPAPEWLSEIIEKDVAAMSIKLAEKGRK